MNIREQRDKCICKVSSTRAVLVANLKKITLGYITLRKFALLRYYKQPSRCNNKKLNYNQLNVFRAIISPILRSTGLCLQLVVQFTEEVACW